MWIFFIEKYSTDDHMTELKISIISDKFWERIKVNWEPNHES